jgi:hypothetical protein
VRGRPVEQVPLSRHIFSKGGKDLNPEFTEEPLSDGTFPILINSYCVTPAGGCGTLPAAVAAAASFRIR